MPAEVCPRVFFIAKIFINEKVRVLKNPKITGNPFDKVNAAMRPLFSELKEFLVSQASRFSPEVREAALESISPSGKFLRPALVFASAAAGNCDRKSLVRRAAVVELIHISTLIHDDVIDGASLRHGEPTPNSKYGARTAILLGDVIFSQTILLACEENSLELSRLTGECVRTICEGEVRQTLSKNTGLATRDDYYGIAFGKTGALFSLACVFGASAISSVSSPWAKAAEAAGRELGVAYQIYDDVCDCFMSEEVAGKTLGTDLEQGRRTFPVIVLSERISRRELKALNSLAGLERARAAAEAMGRLGVIDECRAEFERRISDAERLISPFQLESSSLADFCMAMRGLKFA